METNEQMKRLLREAVQEELERFFAAVEEIAEGQREQLEEQVVQTSQNLGRSLLEGVLDSRQREQRPAARREGSCGHRQRLGGERPKEWLTLVGKVRFVRPYYQCLEGASRTGPVRLAKRPLLSCGACTSGALPAGCNARSAPSVDA